MNAWIASVTGIVLLTVLCDIILPDGKLTKYIKTVTSLIAVGVLLSPLPSFLNGNLTFETFFDTTETQFDSSLFRYFEDEQTEYISTAIENKLRANGIEATVKVTYVVEKDKIVLKKALISVNKKSIPEKDGNILISEVASTVSSLFDFEEGVFVVLNV